ncbi:MAG TPA: hypothetical protein ENH82_05735 [bacterium]|nr:hypothetical protein [bacterium]
MADISDWNDTDTPPGVSSQVTFDSKSCMKLDTGANGTASREQDIGAFGARAVISLNMYFDAIGTIANADNYVMVFFNGSIRCLVQMGSDNVTVYDGAAHQVVGNFVVQDVWQEWTFDIDWTGQTVDIYLDTVLKASNVDCSAASATADGTIYLTQAGATTANRITYIDWFKAGSDFISGGGLQSYSEDTIVEQGTYSLKGIAAITDSLDKTLTKTLDPVIDLSGLNTIEFYAYASRTGSNFKLGFHDSGGTTTEHTVNISSASAWEKQTVDISGVADGDKDAIDSIIVTIVDADVANTFYLDDIATSLIILAYSEDTIKEQGDYSLKVNATITDSLNETLTRTVSPTIDLSGMSMIKFDARSSRTGTNFKIGIHDAGGTTTEHTVNIASINVWQEESWDISGVADGNKDAIDQIKITVTNADSANTLYIDNLATPLIILAYSENTIKEQGDYSLKVFAEQTDSLNETLTRTVDPTIDLSGKKKIAFDAYASRIGINFKLSIHDSGAGAGTTSEYSVNIASSNVWQKESWNISSVADGDKDRIDQIKITVTDADSDNTIYVDDLATALVLQSYSEDTIKQQGDYSLRAFAEQTDSLDETLTRTVDPMIDLSDLNTIKFEARTSGAGSIFKVSIHDSGSGITTEHEVDTASTNTWQTESWDISDVLNAQKSTIDQIKLTITNADSDNTIYVDNMISTTKY